MKKQLFFLILIVVGLGLKAQVHQIDPAKDRNELKVSETSVTAVTAKDPAAPRFSPAVQNTQTQTGIDPGKNAVMPTQAVLSTTNSPNKRTGPVQVVHPSGKEAQRTNYKPVVHSKHEGPTPVVHPTGKEAERVNYKPVVHAKHTGPTPVVHPSGKEVELKTANKR